MLFTEAFQKFVILRQGYVADSTRNRVYFPTRDSVVRILTDRPMDAYTPVHIVDYTQKLLEDHKPSGVNIKLAMLRTFGRWCVKKHVEPDNAFATIELVRVKGQKKRFLSKEEFRAILDEEPNENRRNIYLTLVLTGLRASDVLGLQTKDIDSHRWLIRLIQHKTQTEVFIPVHPVLRPIFQAQMDGEKLFTTPKSVGGLSHAFQLAAFRAEVEHVKLHDLRRTAGAWMVQSNASIFAVSQILGHSSPTITAKLYAALLPENLQSAIGGVTDPRVE